jgi:hypothetical protein
MSLTDGTKQRQYNHYLLRAYRATLARVARLHTLYNERFLNFSWIRLHGHPWQQNSRRLSIQCTHHHSRIQILLLKKLPLACFHRFFVFTYPIW